MIRIIIDKNIEILITGNNIKYYSKTHKNISKGDYITVNQRDVSKYHCTKVECICSYKECSNTYFQIRKNITTDKSYCSKECKHKEWERVARERRKNKVYAKVRERIDNNMSMKYNDIYNDDPSLLYDIYRISSIYDILLDIGITEEEMISDYGLTRNINKHTLTVDEIIDRLDYLKSIGRLSTSAMRTEFNDLRLEQSIKKIYGSVDNCFQELGYERDIYDININVKMGRMFENILNDILIDLGYTFKRYIILDNNTIPDFYIDNGDIIDAKLSSWTTSIDNDIKNYKPFCNNLIFIYLRGNDRSSKNKNIKFINVYDLIDNLNKDKKNYYRDKLSEIINTTAS